MIGYNPFDEKITRLRKIHLDRLVENEVAEGWYIEYKQDFPSAKKVGHSVAAFANSDGGWFIVGVKANRQNVADSVPGFKVAAVRNPKDRLRDIVRNHINPVPFFESTIIEVSTGKVVLVAYIEKGDETPYVTSDGRIYRRVGEGSDPVPETDRYSIQKLFEQSQEPIQRIEAFCQNPFSISQLQAEEHQCWLEAYFYTLPFDRFRFNDFHTKGFFHKLQEIFSTPVPLIALPYQGHILFSNCYTSDRSYILRELPKPTDCIRLGLTVELFENGNVKMLIPVPSLPSTQIGVFTPLYAESVHYKAFLNMILQHGPQLRVIDGYRLFTIFAVLFGQYCDLLKNQHCGYALKARLKFSECWRTLLYLDDGQYLEFLKEHGLAICPKSHIEIPEFRAGNGIPATLEQSSGTYLICRMYEALGLPLAFVSESMYGLGNYIQGLSKPTTGQCSQH